MTGARWCWPFFLGRGGGEAAAGGGCGAGVSAAPDPDLKASVYFNQGCLRWSCFGRPLSPELYLFDGWRWEVAPEKSEASSAGHDGGDARGRRTLLVGAVQVASFPSSFHPARMPGESPNPCRIERQRRSGRRHPLGGVVRGELGGGCDALVAWLQLVAWSEFVWWRCIGALPPMCSASESFFHGAWSSAALPDSAERCFILLIDGGVSRRRGAVEIRRPMCGDGLAQEDEAVWCRGDVDG